jgi:hypothetical protein
LKSLILTAIHVAIIQNLLEKKGLTPDALIQ